MNANNVISLSAARIKKQQAEDLARGRKPLYISHLDGKIYGSPNSQSDLGDRIVNVRERVDKLIALLNQLGKLHADNKQYIEREKNATTTPSQTERTKEETQRLIREYGQRGQSDSKPD